MTKGRDRRAHKRRRREVRKNKRPAGVLPIDTMVEHAFWSQRTDPDIPNYNVVTFRVYGSPMPEHRYEGRAAVERLGRFVESFSAGRASARRDLPPDDRFTPTWQLPERMQRLRQEGARCPKHKPAFATIGRWRFGLSLDREMGLWIFSAQLVDGGKATKADEQRLAAAVEALGVPEDTEPIGKSRYLIWKDEDDSSDAVDDAPGMPH